MVPEGWRQVRLQDLVFFGDAGTSVNSEDRPKGEGELGILKTSAVTYGRFNPVEHKTVLRSEENRVSVKPKRDCILISRMNTLAFVGASVYVDQDYDDLFLPDRLWQAERKSNACSMKWLSYVLASAQMRYRISNIATGTSGSMKNITKPNFLKLKVLLPPLPEQRKIAEILGTWDKAIALTEQLVAAKQQRKKALMQQLLMGRRRFREFVRSRKTQNTRLGIYPDEWTIQRLSDVTEIRFSNVDKKRKPSEQPVLLCNYMDVFNNDYIRNRMEFMEASATEAEIRKFALNMEDVIITKDSETREEIAEPCVVVEDLENVICGYHLAVLRPKRSIISGFFLKDALRSSNVHHQFVKFANGITRFGLNLSAVHNALVPVPPIEEQRKIAAVLQACDREIELLTQKLDVLQRQKKGLMQRLLTGRVRVKM